MGVWSGRFVGVLCGLACLVGSACETLGKVSATPGGSAALPLKVEQQAWNVSARIKLESAEPLAYAPRQRSQPAVDARRGWVFVATRRGKLIALDTEGLKERWAKTLEGPIDGPVLLSGDKLFVATAQGRVASMDAATGELIWQKDLGLELGSPMQIHKDLLLVASLTGSLAVLRADSGELVWQVRGRSGAKLSTRGAAIPRIEGERVYSAFSDGSVVALNLADGAERWHQRLKREGAFGDVDTQPLVIGDRIVVATASGRVVGLKPEDGSVVWEAKASVPGARFLLRRQGRLIVVANDRVVGLDPASGALRWQTKIPHGPLTAPVVSGFSASTGMGSGDELFVSAEQGGVQSLSTRNGRPVSQFSPGTGVSAPPAVEAKDKLFVLSNGGVLYRLER